MSSAEVSPNKKLLMMAAFFPPIPGGSSTLLYNLLRHFPEGSYAAVAHDSKIMDSSSELPCTVYRMPHGRIVDTIQERAWPLVLPLAEATATLAAKNEKPDALFLNCPTSAFMVAGYRVARRMNLPYYVFLHDLWEENEYGINRRAIAHFEADILKGAEKIFTITDMARNYYLDKYGVDSEVLLHTIDPEFTVIPERTRKAYADGEPFRILTSGAFYANMNLDTLQVLNRLLADHPDANLELRILTPQVGADIWDQFADSRITIKSCTKNEVWQELSDADLLYVPLAFRSANPAEIETVFPTKITEYALAETPIMVHGPGHCYTVEYAKKKRWATTVDKPKADVLWNSIDKMMTDEKFRKRFTGAGKKIVKERDAQKISNWLQKELGVI